ncbi:MAG TPA: AAA family ATPase [Steroidobacteraceae bacterium]|nr:AAA family ATPase [Steroidobacteraceae bacterium]
MTSKLEISIPQSAVWLLRLAVNPALSRTLQKDSMAFAAWYAAAGSAIDWPEPVTRIQDGERGKRLPLERMMKLLSQVNYAFSGRTSAGHARLVLEGYAVHAWVQRNPDEFTAIAASAHAGLSSVLHASATVLETLSPFAARVGELGHLIKLSPLERDILSFAFLTTVSDELSGIFEQLAADRWTARVLWTVLFDTSAEELARAMRPRSPLRLSGLLQTAGRRAELARVPAFWVEVLASSDSLADALLEPLDDKIGSGRPARLLEEDLALAIRLLKHGKEPGVNLLLYGDASLEKRQLLGDIVAGAGRMPWRMRRFDDAPREVLPSLTFVAFQLLAAQHPSAVLVIERPADVLHTAPSQFFRAVFGVKLAEDEGLPFDENLLSTNPVPAVWLTSNIASLPDDTIARFVFHAPLKKAPRETQELAIRKRLKKLRLSKEATAQIMKLDGISSAQLESAVRASRLAGTASRSERDHAIVQAIWRSQRALSRELTAFKPAVTHYSLEYLNTSGRFSPQQILQSFRRRPKGSMLLYGPPGTGKTQFTEHLASELNLPLVSKSAAALLSKWLGDSEKNIAAAFAEAAADDAILFFDEGDSFLRSRERAQHGWEVTQTNELLQRMERFEGIVIVATNLFRDLDMAALRRFTFKIEFRELDLSQRWKMFVAEAGLTDTAAAALAAETRESWEKRLLFMKYLTPGDFATVKRQALLLDTVLTPEEWLDQLEVECQIKSAVPRLEAAHRAA